MNKNYLTEAKIIFIVGIGLTILSPFIFTRSLGLIDFSSSGQIGDTIGGLTAPLTSLIGSILVFYALKAQIEANKLIQNQIADQKAEEEIKKRTQYLFDNFSLIREDINSYSYNETKSLSPGFVNDARTIIPHKGSSAINYFISILKDLQESQYEEIFKTHLKLRELKTLLESIYLFAGQVESSKIPDDDKAYIKSLVSYQFNSKIKAPFAANEKYRQSAYTDKQGVNKVKGIPNELFDLVDKIDQRLR